jgi:heat shock transcription factor
MLNDPNNFHLIRWSEAGDSFIGGCHYDFHLCDLLQFAVPNSEHFAREVLGRWFKHQNFQSFVRQLNMYGFHKIPQLQQGVLKSDSDIEIWNFAHPHFRRGEPNLLNFIQRKKQVAQTLQPDGVTEGLPTGAGVVGTINFHEASNGAGAVGSPIPGQMVDMHSIVNGINAIKHHQSNIQVELAELKQSSQMLWQDAMDVRTKYQKQQDTINKILKFLAGVFGNRPNPHKDEGVDALRTRAVIPRRSSRLMIEDGRNKKVGVMEVHDDDDENDTTEVQADVMQGKPLPARRHGLL